MVLCIIRNNKQYVNISSMCNVHDSPNTWYLDIWIRPVVNI